MRNIPRRSLQTSFQRRTYSNLPCQKRNPNQSQRGVFSARVSHPGRWYDVSLMSLELTSAQQSFRRRQTPHQCYSRLGSQCLLSRHTASFHQVCHASFLLSVATNERRYSVQNNRLYRCYVLFLEDNIMEL